MLLAEWAAYDRLRMLTLAFETFSVSSVALVNKAALSMLGAGPCNGWARSGLVLQSGHNETRCTAYYEGMQVAAAAGKKGNRCTSCASLSKSASPRADLY